MTEDDQEEFDRIKANIARSGCHVIHVLESENYPQFTYTIGLFERFNHAEIIMIGFKHTLTHTLLNNMAYDIERGKTFENGEYHEGILDNFHCYIDEVPVMEYKKHVGTAIWFYGDYNFPLMQCVLPTVKGKFPWDKDFPEEAEFGFRVITDAPKEH